MGCFKGMVERELVLGTAQFGMDYGVSNGAGMVPSEELQKILVFARANGLQDLDTASSYGESEKRLGSFGLQEWRVVSKLSVHSVSEEEAILQVDRQLRQSFLRLGCTELYGVLIHNPAVLLGSYGSAIWERLKLWRSRGRVLKIGYSVYSPSELDNLFYEFKPDLVQLPFSVADRRFQKMGWFEKFESQNVEVHVRSIFLQGLLLMSAQKRPSFCQKDRLFFERWDLLCAELNITPLEICLNFVCKVNYNFKVVFGVQNLSQLQEILKAVLNSGTLDIPSNLQIEDEVFLNPGTWSSF